MQFKKNMTSYIAQCVFIFKKIDYQPANFESLSMKMKYTSSVCVTKKKKPKKAIQLIEKELKVDIDWL